MQVIVRKEKVEKKNRAAGLRRMKNFPVMDKKLKDAIKMCITARETFSKIKVIGFEDEN